MTELFIPPDFRFLIDIASIGFLGSSIIANVGLMVYLGWGKLRHCHLTKFILTYNFVNLISTLLLFAECFVPINVLGFQILRICHNTLPLLAAILGFELLKLLSVLMTSWTENTFRKIQYMTIILHTIFTLPNYFNFYIKTPMLKHWGTFGFGIFALSMIMVIIVHMVYVLFLLYQELNRKRASNNGTFNSHLFTRFVDIIVLTVMMGGLDLLSVASIVYARTKTINHTMDLKGAKGIYRIASSQCQIHIILFTIIFHQIRNFGLVPKTTASDLDFEMKMRKLNDLFKDDLK